MINARYSVEGSARSCVYAYVTHANHFHKKSYRYVCINSAHVIVLLYTFQDRSLI